jgi:hypothetical protein
MDDADVIAEGIESAIAELLREADRVDAEREPAPAAGQT